MSKSNRNFWMISPKGFVKLLGAEYDLMHKAGGNTLLKFYASSVVIFLIAVTSFLSICYAIELLFHSLLAEVTLSMFLSGLFVLTYIFLINTLTKDSEARSLFNFSNITRCGFIVFMGFLISKPLEIFLYRGKLNNAVAAYQQKLAQEHEEKVNGLFNEEIKKLQRQQEHYRQLGDNSFQKEIDDIDASIKKQEIKKQELIHASELRISKGGFFIFRIRKVVHDYPLSWLFCLGIVLLFLLPGYLIYSISKGDEYFRLKTSSEEEMIKNAYTAFTQKYTQIFKEKYGVELHYFSKYEDPPFNRKLKKGPQYRSSSDFHNKYAC